MSMRISWLKAMLPMACSAGTSARCTEVLAGFDSQCTYPLEYVSMSWKAVRQAQQPAATPLSLQLTAIARTVRQADTGWDATPPASYSSQPVWLCKLCQMLQKECSLPA